MAAVGRTAAARLSSDDRAPGGRPAFERPSTGVGELRGGALGDRAALGVERPELGAVAVRLLEVVAEDLLELLLAAALPVDALGPGDEALVHRRPRPLEQRAVRRVLDHQVAEAVDLVVAWPGARHGRGTACGSSARRCAGTDGRSESGTSSSIAGCGNARPMTEAGSMIARSSRERSSSRAASRAWIVGGTDAAARSPDAVQSILVPVDQALVDEHRDELATRTAGCPRTRRRPAP